MGLDVWPYQSVTAPTEISGDSFLPVPTSVADVPNVDQVTTSCLMGVWLFNGGGATYTAQLFDASNTPVGPVITLPAGSFVSPEYFYNLPVLGLRWVASNIAVLGKVVRF